MFSSARYLIKEGFRGIWQNRFMAFASVGVLVSCLLLTGFSYIVLANANHMFNVLYEQNVVAVFVEQGATDEQIGQLQTALGATDNVAGVQLITREEMLARYEDELSPALFESLQGEDNPMPDAFLVSFRDLAQFDRTLAAIKGLPSVDEVSYDAGIADTLTQVRSVVLAVGGWVVILLLIVSLFIISNTIKLTVHNRRLEIRIMRSVGATNTFIRVPFVVEGIVLGIASALVAYGMIYYIYARLLTRFTGASAWNLIGFGEDGLWWILLVGFAAIGVLTGAVGSMVSMGKYLNKE